MKTRKTRYFTQLNARVRVLDPLGPLISPKTCSAPNEPISGFSGFGGLGKIGLLTVRQAHDKQASFGFAPFGSTQGKRGKQDCAICDSCYVAGYFAEWNRRCERPREIERSEAAAFSVDNGRQMWTDYRHGRPRQRRCGVPVVYPPQAIDGSGVNQRNSARLISP